MHAVLLQRLTIRMGGTERSSRSMLQNNKKKRVII